MPRRAKFDVPNALQNVMARGIEGREIFWDKKDREELLRWLSEVVIKGEGQSFAWSPTSSHFHLLLGFAQTSVREAIEGAREERDEAR